MQVAERDTVAVGAGNGAGRAVRRRRSLPSGRALVGGLLVAVAAVGVFGAWLSATAAPTSSYVVARHDIAPGHRVTRADLALVRLHLPPSLRARAFDDVGVLVGATALGPLAHDELVQAGDVVRSAGPGTRALSFPVDADRALAGHLRPGERVDVLATYGSGGDAYTLVVARGVQVVDVEEGRGTLGDRSRVVLTLALERDADELALVHAAHAGQVTVVRASGSAAGGAPPTYRPRPEPAHP